MRRRMESRQGRRQGREGNEVAAILERVQQAPQGGRLAHDPEKRQPVFGKDHAQIIKSNCASVRKIFL